MFVNFEFLGSEPIENVITCMHFKMDKAIYFGYAEVIAAQRQRTERFLKKYCGVEKVAFLPLSHTDLSSVIRGMSQEIERELSNGNNIFFDITGGESLFLVAFGFLSPKYNVPIHTFDIEKDKLITLNPSEALSIDKCAPAARLTLDIDKYVELHGGIINHGLHKGIKGDSEKLLEKTDELWGIVRRYTNSWNAFSSLCRSCFVPDEELYVEVPALTVSEAMRSGSCALNSQEEIRSILVALNGAGAVEDLSFENESCRFRYASADIKQCIWDSGSIFELYIYRLFAQKATFCRIGVHIDWDGVIHQGYGKDVLNEVDVIALSGNIPTFISCKGGKMSASATLHALYELQTVAQRFGGRYARKVLATINPLPGDVYMERAGDMGIDVMVVGDDMP